jgi:glycosyltransferase involved in cell wall biosynthesis
VSTLGETSAPYNQFALPLHARHDITFCSYFPATVRPPSALRLFEGDGSLRGFFRALRSALDDADYEIIHAHAAPVAALFLLGNVLYRRPLHTTVFTLHNSFQNLKVRNRFLLLLILLFRRVVCCGESSLSSVPAVLRWIGGRRLVTVTNGLDIDRVDRSLPGDQERDPEDPDTVVLSVGRLIKMKNPGVLLTAFQRCAHRPSRLVFVGEGALRASLELRIREAGIADRVKLRGLLPRQQVYQELSAADVLVSTSHGEGLPVAVLEAMACRRPVILSDIPPHREIVGDAGFVPLVPPNDVDGFACEIERLLKASPSERKQIGESGRKLVEDRFSLAAMHRGYAEIYRELSGRDGW